MSISNAAIFGPTFVPGKVGDNQPVIYFDDFMTGWTILDASPPLPPDQGGKFCNVADAGEWFLTTGGSVGTYPSMADEVGGVVTMTTGGVTGNRINCQLNGEMFSLEGARELYFEARVHLSTSADFYMGVAVTDPDLDTIADGVTFGIEGTSILHTRVEKDGGGAITATAATLEDDAYSVLAFKCRADRKVEFYLNGVRVALVDAPTTYPDNEELAPAFHIESNGAAETLKIDYILCVGER